MAMFGERIDSRDPGADGGGRADALHRPPRGGRRPELVERMDWAEEKTADNDRIALFVAFNYGGRAEIVDAARSFQGSSEEEFRRHLYAPEMHDPDLLIRTSGEQRHLQLPALAVRLLGAGLPRRALARLRPRRASRSRLREYETRQRRFGAPRVTHRTCSTTRLFDDDPPSREPKPPREPRRKAPAPRQRRDGEAGPRRPALDRLRDRDHRRRRRRLRRGDDRDRRRLPARVPRR